MTTLQASVPQQNSVSMASLLADAAQLGAEQGKGKDTQVKMLMRVVEGGYHSAADLDQNKHGTGIDDATQLAAAYVKAQGSATQFDAKAPNQRKLISCFRTAIKLGSWPKGGTGQPLGTLNDLMTMRDKMRKDPQLCKKLDDAANTVMKYARTQIKRDQLMSTDELRGLCFKPDKDLKSAEEIVESIRNQLRALKDGKAASGTAQDNSKQVEAAIQLMTKRLTDIATARGNANQAHTPAVTTFVDQRNVLGLHANWSAK